MKRKIAYKTTCPICKKDFQTVCTNRVYCSDACQREAGRIKNHERGVQYKVKRQKSAQKKTRKANELTEIDKLARAAGMTYGQYVAKYGI